MTHSENAENPAPEVVVWHDEADRLAAWGTLDPTDACMCRDCVLPPAETRAESDPHATNGRVSTVQSADGDSA